MEFVEKGERHGSKSQGRGQSHAYPTPLLVQPKSGTHKQTFIVLHGRGSTAEEFGPPLLDTAIPDFGTLQTAFPNAKFIFPTASRRRAQAYNRSLTHQWFDNWNLEDPTEREELQYDGLLESSAYIHSLLKGEVEAVGAKNVVLWGLSQGCAASLISMFLWEGEPFAAVVGMCGWLPLQKRIIDAVLGEEESLLGDDDPFASDEGPEMTPFSKASACLREVLGVPASTEHAMLKPAILVFIGHGAQDEKVPPRLAQEAAESLKTLDLDVVSKQYDGLGHWYSGEMLKDIVLFLKGRAGFPQ